MPASLHNSSTHTHTCPRSCELSKHSPRLEQSWLQCVECVCFDACTIILPSSAFAAQVAALPGGEDLDLDEWITEGVPTLTPGTGFFKPVRALTEQAGTLNEMDPC